MSRAKSGLLSSRAWTLLASVLAAFVLLAVPGAVQAQSGKDGKIALVEKFLSGGFSQVSKQYVYQKANGDLYSNGHFSERSVVSAYETSAIFLSHLQEYIIEQGAFYADPDNVDFVATTLGKIRAPVDSGTYLSIRPNDIVNQVTVTTEHGAHGTISPSPSAKVNVGGSLDLLARPDPGYIVDYWVVDFQKTQSGGDYRTLHLANITKDRSVSVYFKLGSGTRVVTPYAGPNGSIVPAKPQFVTIGGSVTFTAVPEANYIVDGWLEDGYRVANKETHHALVNVLTDHEVKVLFKRNSAELSVLSSGDGVLAPAFAPETTKYQLQVPPSTESVTVQPTVAQPGATVRVNGIAVASGSASRPIPLNGGSGTITITVTAPERGTTKTYTVEVSSAHDVSTLLNSLTPDAGVLVPPFKPEVTQYELQVEPEVTEVAITAETAAAGTTVSVNGLSLPSGAASSPIALAYGDTSATIVVTAPSRLSKKTYQIQIRRPARFAGFYQGVAKTVPLDEAGGLRLSIAASGRFSGSYFDDYGRRIALRGAFPPGATTCFAQGPNWDLTLAADPKNPGLLTGLATVAGVGRRLRLVRNDFLARTKQPAPQSGRYTLMLPADGVSSPGGRPYGTGYGMLNITPRGSATLTLSFADGRTATVGTLVSSRGELPVVALPYRARQGSASGWLTLAELGHADGSGALDWHRAEDTRAPYYRAPFGGTLPIFASRYTHRPADPIIGGEPVYFEASAAGADPAPRSLQQANGWLRTALGLSPSSVGRVQGTYTEPGYETLSLAGVVFQKRNIIAGSFLLRSRQTSGRFAVSAAPPQGITTVQPPTFDVPPGVHPEPFSVSLACRTPGATIRYTVDDSDPTIASTLYVRPIAVASSRTVKARAFKTGLADSPVAEAEYFIGTRAALSPPLFTPAGSVYSGAIDVTLTSAAPAGELRFTVDGSDPTTASPLYISPIRVASSTTLKARAFAAGLAPSRVATARYAVRAGTETAAPALSPPPGEYVESVAITASSATAGAIIRYTDNGSEPTTTSPILTPYNYLAPGGHTFTLKVKAFAPGLAPSATAQGTYRILPVYSPFKRGSKLDGAAGSSMHFKITVPTGQTHLEVSTFGGTGNCDLYVKYGGVAMPASFDFASRTAANNERIAIEFPAAGNYYITLFATTAYAGLELSTHQSTPGFPDARTNPSASAIYSTAVQPDGKVLFGGIFTTVSGAQRRYLARLNADGTVDTSFSPSVSSSVWAIAVQPDGRILIGGHFTTVNGAARNHVARLYEDGTLDPFFNPNANDDVNCFAFDGSNRLLLGGNFTSVGGQSRRGLARVALADGALDTTFNANVAGSVSCLALDRDGDVLLGGSFSSAGGVARQNLAALVSTTGSATSFSANTNGLVTTLLVEPSGMLVVGGQFTSVRGLQRSKLARVDAASGAVDTGFAPDPSGDVYSLALQSDEKIVVGGLFTKCAGVTRNRLARLNRDGSLDAIFNPNVDNSVFSISLQPTGEINVGGAFSQISGVPRSGFARLQNQEGDSAFSIVGGSRLEWQRRGTSAEASVVTFEVSRDAQKSWTLLGLGTQTNAGWNLPFVTLPAAGFVRARAFASDGISSGLVEARAHFGTSRGHAWERVISPTLRDLRAVVRHPLRFVAVGEGGTILTSPNGVDWTTRSSPTTSDLLAATVTSTGDVYAAGVGGTILFSGDGGVSWTTRSSGTTTTFNALAHDPGLSPPFVAVGASGLIKTSSTGATWTTRTSGTTSTLRAVSSDGRQWNVGGSSGVLLTSPDGVNWASRSTPSSDAILALIDNRIAVGANGLVFKSVSGGASWTTGEVAAGSYLRGVTRTEDLYVAVGDSGGVYQSEDGAYWDDQRASSTNTSLLHSVAYDSAARVLVTVGAGGVVFVSK